MKRLILVLAALLLPLAAFGADRCVSAIGTRTTGSCAATCTAADFQTAANCYNATAQGSSSVTTALTQSTTDGDTITIDDGIFPITTNILAANMTGPNPGTVTIRCRTATRGSCEFKQSSATAAIFSLGNATITTNFIFQNIGCTKSVTHTSTTVAACFHNSGAATGNVTLDSVYAHDITWNVGTSTAATILSNATSSSNKTTTIQGNTLVTGITATGTASIPAVIGVYSGTNDLVVTDTFRATNITATDAQSMFQCADDCDFNYEATDDMFSGLTIIDTDAQWHGVIDATDPALTATITGVRVGNSTFRISSSTSIGAILGKFQGPALINKDATYGSSGCHDNTVTLISGSVSTPIGPCWIAAGANANVVTMDGLIYANTAPIGLCGYANQGGQLTQWRTTCIGNTAGQGLVYCGGWGACNFYSGIVGGNTQDNTGEGIEGFVFVSQLQSTATSARTSRIWDSTFINNTPLSSAVGSVYFRNNDDNASPGCTTSCVQTLDIENSVIRNGKTQEIVTRVTGTSGGQDVLNIKNSNLTDKDDPTAVEAGGSGTVNETFTNNQESDPLLVGNCGSLVAGQNVSACDTTAPSPLRNAGKYNSTVKYDHQNCRFRSPRTIGAREVCAGSPN